MEEMMLPIGTVLEGRYRIEGHIASGGFGKTYVATDLRLGGRVAVKEFFMHGINQRDGDATTVSVSNPASRQMFDEQRRKFQKEARRLSKINNPYIVKVSDLFDANNTSYYVMDYIDGNSLSGIQKNQGHPFSEQQVLDILPQMLDALECIHSQSIWHMDIKPGNILMDSHGHCTLVDFGSSKQTSISEGMTTSTALSYTPGYAPPEQMNGSKDNWGPWTDFYALGATLYNLLTGNRPPSSDVITDLEGDAFSFPATTSEETRQLIVWMITLSTKKRPQNASEIRGRMEFKPSVEHKDSGSEGMGVISEQTVVNSTSSSESTVYGPVETNEKVLENEGAGAGKKTDKRIYWVIGILVLMVAVVLIFGLGGKESGKENDADPKMFDSSQYSNGEKKTFNVNGVSFNMVKVDGGSFMMGATPEQGDDVDDNEKPAHNVTLDEYMIGQTEVTQELWKAVMGENPSNFKGNLQRPVEQVSWHDCQEFIRKLNSLTGQHFRLPTEAEWEYAARGGNKSQWYKYSGSNNLGNVAWYYENAGYGVGENDPNYGTHPVSTKSPNELGIYDMSGNVWEWCQDLYDENYYARSPQNNPTGPSSRSDRVYRGGSWYYDARYCRVAYRNWINPDFRNHYLGFRLVL